MHSSLLENMQNCYEQFVCGKFFQEHEFITVLDLDGPNKSQSFREIYSSDKFHYITAKQETAENYKLDLENETVDIVISGQAFGYIENYWLLFQEMARVISQNGLIFLITQSYRNVGRHSPDYHEFYPDTYNRMAMNTGIHLLKVHQDFRGPENDLVGVFAKNIDYYSEQPTSWHPIDKLEVNRYLIERLPTNKSIERGASESETVRGGRNYLSEIEDLHNRIDPDLYVEIGVRKGKSLALSKCKSIAIDPEPNFDINQFNQVELFKMPSDYYFENYWPINHDSPTFDLAFIDGMHLFEFVLRDFMNLEARSAKNAVIIIDDIFPNHPDQASRNRNTRIWTGDVWKFLICLRKFRPDLKLEMLDVHPTGLLVISRLDSENRVLMDQYNTIIQECINLSLENFTDLILNRREALNSLSSPIRKIRSAIIWRILRLAKTTRFG